MGIQPLSKYSELKKKKQRKERSHGHKHPLINMNTNIHWDNVFSFCNTEQLEKDKYPTLEGNVADVKVNWELL